MSERATEGRKRVRRFCRCMEIGMFIPNAFAGFPVKTQKSLSMCTEREVRKKSAPDRTRTYTSRDTRS